jgi:glycosyltransferase involved in cell wall biosynthesis
MPALGGNGLAMRAGTVLRALATRYRVTLLVVPRYWSPTSALPDALARCCQQVVVAGGEYGGVPLPSRSRDAELGAFRWLLRSVWKRPGPTPPTVLRDEPFDVVHVFRLTTIDPIRPWLEASGRPQQRHLDLDDVESISRQRIADRYEQTGQHDLARRERAEAEKAISAEAAAIRDFDRVYVCSEGDRQALEARRLPGSSALIAVLPNALPSPPLVGLPPDDRPFTLLFVGTLSFYPNEDAIVTFCREVVPSLRRMATRPFRIAIVGIGATSAVQALAEIPEVDVVGAVDDVAEWYRAAHAAIVPIQAGGGTRIKIIEAFAYGRPVVATTIGTEGVAAQDGVHLLIADEPRELARACARLMASAGLCRRLAEQARSLYASEYSTEALIRRVRALP